MNQTQQTPRRLAIDALVRIDKDGAYANLVVPNMLEKSTLEPRDRGFVTELVYGTTRMRRALDFLVDRFLLRDDVEPMVRAALRMGAYQLAYLGTPAHAGVSATVAAVPKRVRGIVNAVLRKVAAEGLAVDRSDWPSIGIELSYPDWIIKTLIADLGEDAALAALRTMNTAATVSVRDDGYRQDPSSQRVAELVQSGGVVVDVCAAPGGKATALARADRFVVAGDLRPARVGLIATNRTTLDQGAELGLMVMDGLAPALRPGSADAVLVDAPCTGLGALRRRPDARWRIKPDDVVALSTIQTGLLAAAAELVRPGGEIVYSVCTLTSDESLGVLGKALEQIDGIELDPAAFPAPWQARGDGAQLLPQDEGGDGMFAARLRRS